MKLKDMLDMFTSASSANMRLNLKNGEIVSVTKEKLTYYDSNYETILETYRNEQTGRYPWLDMCYKFGEVEIKDFTLFDDTLIFWE